MANIHLINALYPNSKPSVPFAPAMQPTTMIESERPTAAEKQPPAAAVAVTQVVNASKQVENRQSHNGDTMHPDRQFMVQALGWGASDLR